ncbi:hypothetical protein BPAE_0218g00160 [Botrytis paeoniae]|uniref:Uncharacterized protein n=1 Tax=Botrytis paeoniae TaxID=278948 RepID=A0A4Z1FFQ6_9HELO|nr:hypothetical protein BPAE_0218g00160 [Botrytis paeoniae]
MSAPEPPSRTLSKAVFYNPNGIRSEGIRCPVDRDYNEVIYELYTIERESIRVAILDPSSWQLEDPTDDTGQGENGFEDYSRWEDKRKEFEDMFHAAFTDHDGLLYHDRDSDPRISISKITFYGITELES